MVRLIYIFAAPFLLPFCYQTETFFTFFSKFKGLLKIVLLKNLTECVILCPRFGRRYVKIPSPGPVKMIKG